ncbi:fimbrial protein [Providencia rettgeri]|nr:fimbrial protein [Providencia rettgeri]
MKKKLISSIIATSFIALFSIPTLSAPVANLKISGDIKPPSCTINGLDNPDIVFEFNIPASSLSSGEDLKLNGKTQAITVFCDASTYLSLRPVDNRAGTELTEGIYNFGLGTHGDNNIKIGYYDIILNNGFYRQSPGSERISASFRKNLNSLTYPSFKLDKTAAASWADASTNSGLAAGQEFTAGITVSPTINGSLKNEDSVLLDGNAVLEFSFGL